MARLIPSFTDERTPPGERDVFTLLAAGPDEWVAIHSLDLAPWNRGLRTEIDFVVIAPDSGILCLEVKSHERISFDGERWYPETINRSPFKQACDGRHAFYRRLSELMPQLRAVPVVHCCIFPRSVFSVPPNMSVLPCEIMDSRTFRQFRSGAAFCDDLRHRIMQSVAADPALKPIARPVSRDIVESIVRCCLPVQKRHPDQREEIRRREEELEQVLLEQQKPAVRLAALNDRLVVSGGAGTGKTMIAMEVACRAAESGRRVALLCYNQLIGEWMKQRMARAGQTLPNLLVGRAIRVMADIAGVAIPSSPSADFWDITLPQQLEERFTDPDFKAAASVDYLILDEAQDLMARRPLWHCLIHLLSGGLERGVFTLFGDFEQQVLTERAIVRTELDAVFSVAKPAQWKLMENCRNYRIVGDTAVQLAGLADIYSGYMRIGGSLDNYDIFFYENDRGQLDTLGQLLRHFKAQGYKPYEITLLSFRADEFSAAARLKQTGYALQPAWQKKEVISYASIHAFKGMENKVIVLTDMLVEEREFHRDLFYIGMTRATESVRVLCDKRSQATLYAWLSGKKGS